MKRLRIVLLAGLFAIPAGLTAQPTATGSPDCIPFLKERLESAHWRVRYGLLNDLTGRDVETKHILEKLARDPHESVGSQALVRYVDRFVQIDRSVFDPQRYAPGRFPLTELHDKEDEILVDFCLGRRNIESINDAQANDMLPPIPIIGPANRDDPRIYDALTIVGVLGKREDSAALRPFLESTNDYVVLGAAKALIRLGDGAVAVDTLVQMTTKDPAKHLYYITESLYVLKEIGHPEFESITLRVLAAVENVEALQTNWLTPFLLLAAEATDHHVWDLKAPSDPQEQPGHE